MAERKATDERRRVKSTWSTMKTHKKIGFIFGVLTVVFGVVNIVWALLDNVPIALSSLLTAGIGVIVCYLAVKYGDQY